MKRRLIAFILVVIVITSFSVPVFAETRAARITPSLSFSGTTANCRVTVSASQQDIDATLELWDGNTMVNSWSKSGSSYVLVSGTHACVSGRYYTVKVSGTIDDVAFSTTGATVKCP